MTLSSSRYEVVDEPARGHRSFFAEQGVDDPARVHVLPAGSTVFKDVRVRAAGVVEVG
jgi:hypothetical protein